MDENQCFPVYFECPDLLQSHEKRVEIYFRNHRKSGGGDGGPLRRLSQGLFTITFKHQKDQREVLHRSKHVVNIGDVSLKFTVRDAQVSPPLSSPQTDPTPGRLDGSKRDTAASPKSLSASSPPPSGEEHELQLNQYLLRYLKDCPKAAKWLKKQEALFSCTCQLYPEEEKILVKRVNQSGAKDRRELDTLFEELKNHYICHHELEPHNVKTLLESSSCDDEVKVYSEVGMAVVVGESSQVDARLKALKGRSSSKVKQSITWRLGEAKLRLLWSELEQSLHRDYPEVTVTKGDGGQLVLEGTADEILKADEFISEKANKVIERTVSDINPRVLAFLKKAYGDPGSDFLGFGVEIELKDTELRLFSFSAANLDQTERDLRGKFKLVKSQVPNLSKMAYPLWEKLRPTIREVNREACRVDVLIGSDDVLYLAGHTKEVDEINKVVKRLISELSCENRERKHQQESAQEPVGLSHATDDALTSPISSSGASLEVGAEARQETVQQVAVSDPPQDLSSLSSGEDAEVEARYSLGELEVLVCLGDITKQKADALVNAANEDLKHGGGVALALSKAGGAEVQQESSALVKNIGKITVGDVVVTTGGKLKCKKLLHAVGPEKHKAGGREKVLIQKAIASALNLCEIMEFNSIALPCISSGVFGVPVHVCSEAIVGAVGTFGGVAGRSLNRITLIDNRREVVRALKAACDGLLPDVSSGNGGSRDGAGSLDSAGGAAAGGSGESVRVEVIQGTIETQQVEAVVSPMVRGDPLSTRVGNSLFKAAGRQLTDIFRKEEGVGEMPGDSVLVEGLTGLPFNAVFFVNLVPWDHDPNGTAVEVLRLAVSNVLTSCENQGFSSVALPVLGAGIILGFPEEVTVKVLLEEVHNFEQRRTSRSPFLVHIVYHLSDKTFETTFSSVKKSLQRPVSKESATKRIVLLGKTGSGKSSLGNTIFGEKVFMTDDTPNSGTSKCRAETKTVNGRSVTLIDTPGFFDSGRPEEELKPEILSCITECAPGPHAFLIVLKVEKFSEQEQAIINKIYQYFSEEALQYASVVFTHGNQLPPGANIQEFISKSRPLSELVKKCGDRCHVVDNTYWDDERRDEYRRNDFQVEELLKTIDKMVTENNWGFYTNKAFKAVEKEIEKEEEIIKKSGKNMTSEEIRTKAKNRVSERILISLAGIGTGAMLGVIFGVEALVRLFIAAVQNTATVNGAQKAVRAVGLTATGEAALTAGAVTLGAAALGGGVAGGVIGGRAADGADSVQDAYEKAKKAVMDARESAINALN